VCALYLIIMWTVVETVLFRYHPSRRVLIERFRAIDIDISAQ